MDNEENVLNIENEDGLSHNDEQNVKQSGEEQFFGGEESFLAKEENESPSEENLESLTKKKKSAEKDHDHSSSSSSSSAATSSVSQATASSLSLTSVAITLTGAVAVIGGAAGLIQIKPSNNVSMFLSSSTRLGFSLEKEEGKTYRMLLRNQESEFTKEVTFNKEFVFEGLAPNTVYDLSVYDTSVDPEVLVYSAEYMTKAFDRYSATVESASFSEDVLTFALEYEGSGIEFVTVEVEGDVHKNLYRYEGAPIEEVTVNTQGDKNVSCKVSLNGEVSYFEYLATEEKVIPVESITLNKSLLELKVGQSEQLSASILPENATQKLVSWSSVGDAASVDSKGVVTALKPGEATIIASTPKGEVEATCQVVVKEDTKLVPVTSITLDKESLELSTGDRYSLKATVLPKNASDKSIVWKSDNEEVATVKQGVINALKAGSANITATTVDGNFSASCALTVIQKIVPVTGVSLPEEELSLAVGETKQLSATVLPLDATNQNVSWEVKDETVVSVDENGLLTALKAGETIVLVKTEEGGYKDYCLVSVQ